MSFDIHLDEGLVSSEGSIYSSDISGSICQRSLAGVVSCSGVALHSGVDVGMRIVPASSGSGIVFRRMDLVGDEGYISASYENIDSSVRRCTRLVNGYGYGVSTVEHVLSSLSAFGIDNALIELDGDEVPVMDGSCREFVSMILSVGVEDLLCVRKFLRIVSPVRVFDGDGECSLVEFDGRKFSYTLDYGDLSIGCQSYSFDLGCGDFVRDVASARTFGFVDELEGLRGSGYALGASLCNTIGLESCGGVVSGSELRYSDELVRHKLLDSIGDMSLSGYGIIGHFSGFRSGHYLNGLLLRELFSDSGNYVVE